MLQASSIADAMHTLTFTYLYNEINSRCLPRFSPRYPTVPLLTSAGVSWFMMRTLVRVQVNYFYNIRLSVPHPASIPLASPSPVLWRLLVGAK